MMFRPIVSARSPTSARWTASGFSSTHVRSAILGSFLRLLRGLRGRRGSFLFFLLGLLPLASLHLGPLSVEPGFEDAAAFLGVLPGRELGLFDVGHRLRAVLLLGPAEDRRPEGWALDEGREEFLDLSSREVRTEPFVDQVGEIRRDVLALRRLDRRLAGGGLGGRGHFLGDDRLFGGGSSRRAAERLRPRCPTRHAPEVEQVRLAFVGAEQEDGPILPDEHLAGPRFDLVAAEGTGTAGRHRLHRTKSLRASRAVSLSINTSPPWMLPITLRVLMPPLSRHSSTMTVAWTASPGIPVRPTTSTTSAGILSSSAIVSPRSFESLLHRAELAGQIVEHRLRLAGVQDRD